MKKSFFTLSCLFASFFVMSVVETNAQALISTPAASPSSTVKQKLGLAEVSVTYNRPSARGREVFGKLVPFGEAWRTGANGSTVITTDADLSFDGKTIPAGSYGIYTIPDKDNWTVIFNKNTKAGGDLSAYNDADDVLRVKVPVKKMQDKTETFTITFDNITESSATLDMIWENTKVSIPVKQDVNAIVLKQIENFEKNPMRTVSNAYYQAASYFLAADLDMKKAVEYIDKAIENKYDTYWVYRTKSLIHAKMNDFKGALEAAKISLEKAKAAGDNHYARAHERRFNR